MNCDWVRKLLPFYFYGELPPEDEERVEEHAHACAACAGELERRRRLAAALDRRRAEPPPLLLEECRAELRSAIEGGAPGLERPPAKGPWTLFLEAVGATLAGFGRLRQPVGALALVALGFLAARFTGAGSGPAPASPGEVYASVRSVEPDNAGRVTIAFDETRRREISGSMDDRDIQKLLLTAARGDNPAVQMESVGLLRERTGSDDVREVLVNLVSHDSNAGVRLQALEGLKARMADPRVRQTVAGALQEDGDPTVRMHAVDLLVARRDDSIVGFLQDLAPRESNDYVRWKCEKALKDWNASVGTF